MINLTKITQPADSIISKIFLDFIIKNLIENKIAHKVEQLQLTPGVGYDKIQSFMGHKNVNLTERYARQDRHIKKY